jgi:small acid-soluble spore protein F (minor alpha/beta-type SASP)
MIARGGLTRVKKQRAQVRQGSKASCWLRRTGQQPSRGSIVSDEVKFEIAKELGFADRIQVQNGNYDYSNITTREAGLIVRRLIEKAQESMIRQG